MKLYAISDLHLGYQINRQALTRMSAHPEDWLILAGDTGESEKQLRFAMAILSRRFAKLIWVPGNHDLWTLPGEKNQLCGGFKYQNLVEICRSYGAITPEDPYIVWSGQPQAHLIVPTFTLYDYSFRPGDVSEEDAIPWAMEGGILCKDESFLHSAPYPSKSSWCAERCLYTESRLRNIGGNMPIVLVNHFPIRRDVIKLIHIPRFSIWCGSQRTEAWHTRFPVSRVVYGHLHIRATNFRDGVRFDEVSLGYPSQWKQEHGMEYYLREILPGREHSIT